MAKRRPTERGRLAAPPIVHGLSALREEGLETLDGLSAAARTGRLAMAPQRPPLKRRSDGKQQQNERRCAAAEVAPALVANGGHPAFRKGPKRGPANL